MTIQPRRSVTLQDVAKVVRVSAKTVSRVINGEPGVNAETRTRILRAIEELDYRPNLNAKSLASDRSFLIGLFFEKSGDYLSDFQDGAIARCRESAYHLIVEPCDPTSPELSHNVTNLLRQLRLEAAVLLPPLSDNPVIIKALQSFEVPIVQIAPQQAATGAPVIRMDDYAAARTITGHLLDLGHRDIGFILGRKDHIATERRHQGFLDEMKARGVAVDPNLVLPGNFEYADGLACAARMLDAQRPPTAIFASNDDTAAAVISMAQQRGLKLPDDLSVAGFDDAPVSRMIWPQITTIRQPVASMARAAADLIIETTPRRRGWPDPMPDILLDYELVVRASTAAPRH